jgi:L-lactate utilization protein LutC
MNTFNVEIEAPKSVNLTAFNSHEIQAAFNHFFLQNPQILIRIFETLQKTPIKPPLQQSQEKVVSRYMINPSEAYTDAQWDQLSPDLRSELETQYVLNNPELMKKITQAEENYRQGRYFIPTDEQLGFDSGD